MGKIILPDFMGNLNGKANNQTELFFRLERGTEIHSKMIGDPNIIMEMVYQSIESDKQIKHAVITAVLMWADKKGIAKDELTLHSYFNPKNL